MIEKLLVANRGEIARRIMKSARSLGMACVAVHSDPDAGALHVLEADEAVRLPGERSSDTYLHIDAVVDAALRSGAQGVHPGYGFLSENARLARACESAGLVFVGPPPAVMEAMGSKLEAKATMQRAGVPVLPTVEVKENDGLVDRAAQLGWPVLVKASAGGGGRGMRVVEGPDTLFDSVASARREAQSAFADSTVFLEPYARRPRHVEVQVIGDQYGTIVHLFERECSIQRRHQKIVEEAPASSLGVGARAELHEAALRAARAIGYVNAGTVEFLLLEDGRFAFLEMNTRLQVEHTVTEAVTGLDLVRLQLLVAEGQRLPPEVLEAAVVGHAIEARLYAEDPTASWRPSAGTLHRFFVPTSDSIRVDSGVQDGSQVPAHYDPLLAKVIAHAPSRHEAARVLARALEIAEIHGPRTNRDLLVRILRHPDFLAGDTDTGFLERHDPAEMGAPLASDDAERLHAVAAALAAQAGRRRTARVLSRMPSGWRNVPGPPQRCSFEGREGALEVSYSFDRTGRLASLEIDGKARDDVLLLECTPTRVVLEVEATERPYKVHRVGDLFFVDGSQGASELREVERFPPPGSQLEAGALVAPLPGTVVKVDVALGARVAAGDTLVAIEAMKMEHEVRAGATGTVKTLNVSPGDQVDAGAVLAVIEPLQAEGTRPAATGDKVPGATRATDDE
jgi:propionyl-CoA carboxylase alpha chain